MKEQRLFIRNLPLDTSNRDVLKLFKKYKVSSAEVRKKNTLDYEIVFAHINIPEKFVDECFREYQNYKWKNHVLKIEVAKENFLDKLKRERAQKSAKRPLTEVQSPYPNFLALNSAPKNKKIRFDINEETNDSCGKQIEFKNLATTSNLEDDVDIPKSRNLPMFQGFVFLEEKSENVPSRMENSSPDVSFKNMGENAELSMKKFEAFSDVWKDDKPSENFSFTNSDSKTKKIENSKKSYDLRKNESNHNSMDIGEVKRKSAMEEKWNSYKAKKNIIKTALRKVTFHNNPNLNVTTNESAKNSEPKQEKIKLFEDDSAGEDEFEPNFEVKPELTGERGLKMLNLKAKLASDERFKMNQLFYETNEDRTSTNESALQHSNKINRPLIHYDIKRVETFETSSSSTQAENKKKKTKKHLDSKKCSTASEVTKPEVSKEKHYTVSVSLKDAFKKSEDQQSFSLAALFDQQLKPVNRTSSEDAIIESVSLKKLKSVKNPLEDDSASEVESINSDNETPLEVLQNKTPSEKVLGKCGVWGETFFFKPDDSRLKEAELFYLHPSKVAHIDFNKRRTKLKSIVRKKIQNSMRDRKLFKRKLGGKINKNKFKMRLKKIGAR